MVSLSSTSTFTRYLQAGLSACVLGLSATILKQRGTLSSMANDLATYYTEDTDSSSSSSKEAFLFNGKSKDDDENKNELSILNLDTHWKSSAISLSGSSISICSNGFNYLTPKLIAKRSKSSASSTSFLSSFSISELFSMGSLVSSELASHGLWAVSSVVMLAQYGSWNCDSVESLLTQYNLTSVPTSTILQEFFKLGSSSSDESASYNFTALRSLLEDITDSNISFVNITSLLSDLSGDLSDSTESLDLSTSANYTISELQSEILIALSKNCATKKALLSMSVLTLSSYFVTGGTMAASAIQLIMSWKRYKSSTSSSSETDEPAPDQENQNSNLSYNFNNDWLFPTLEKGNSFELQTEV